MSVLEKYETPTIEAKMSEVEVMTLIETTIDELSDLDWNDREFFLEKAKRLVRPMRIVNPYGSSLATNSARVFGRTPTRMRPPSSGGMGNKLKTASIALRISAFRRFSPTQRLAVAGRSSTSQKPSPARTASARFMAGPAAATRTMPRRGQRSARKFTGTGLA
jgi:hypothetical protein